MIELLAFIAEHPSFGFPLFVLAVLCVFLVRSVAYQPARIVGRVYSGRNIGKHGWPPPHCDADGDTVSTSDD